MSHALERMLTSKPLGINHASTYVRTPIERLNEETIGVCAEYAFCALVGITYRWPINEFHSVPDCGDAEIRGTWRSDGRLIIRDNDSSDRWFYLLTTRRSTGPWVIDQAPPTMVLRGFIKGRDAKRAIYRDNPNNYRPCWMVPQTDLQPWTVRSKLSC